MTLKEILENKDTKHSPSGKLSVSSVGGCFCKKYSELKKIYKEEFSETMFRIFAQGDFFHQRLVSEFTSKGPNLGYEVAAAEVNIRPNKYISGRCDMLLSHAPSKKLYVVDFKSCSPYAFKNVQKGEVSQTYQDQVLLYQYFFHIPRGYLLFVNKASSEVEEFEVIYNEPRAEFLIKQIKYFFQNFVEKDVLPPKCDGGIFGCGCCYPDAPNNKPTSEQLEATLKQQDLVPELFKPFESTPETSDETPQIATQNNSETQTTDKWVKV